MRVFQSVRELTSRGQVWCLLETCISHSSSCSLLRAWAGATLHIGLQRYWRLCISAQSELIESTDLLSLRHFHPFRPRCCLRLDSTCASYLLELELEPIPVEIIQSFTLRFTPTTNSESPISTFGRWQEAGAPGENTFGQIFNLGLVALVAHNDPCPWREHHLLLHQQRDGNRFSVSGFLRWL